MALSEAQRAKLEAEARSRGLDPAKLIEAAEKRAGKTAGPDAEPSGADEPPKLFQYHLPFVTVKEVRSKWLGLSAPFAGDDEVASDWSARHSNLDPNREPGTES